MVDSRPLPGKYQKAVQGGKLVRCSVSQVKVADDRQDGGCLRRWWFQKVAGIKEPETAAMKESTKAHEVAENYLKTGIEPAGNNACERAFLAGKFMLPAVGSVNVERPFDGEISLADVPFNGKLDVEYPNVEDDGMMRVAKVRDHKFIRSISEKAMMGDKLERDPQMVGYGMVAQVFHPGVTHVDLGHFNYQKEEPREEPGREVFRIVPVDVIQKRWYGMAPIVERMKDAASEAEAASIPGNYNACLAFGKKYACPHYETCQKLKGQKPAMKTMELSMEEKIAFGMVDGPAPAAPPPVIAAAPAPKLSLIMPSCAECGADLNPDHGSLLGNGQWKHIGCGGKSAQPASHLPSIIPPDAPKSDPELAAACPACETEKNFQHRPEDCPKRDGAPVKEKKPRGKKAKAETAPSAEAVVAESIAQSEAIFAEANAERPEAPKMPASHTVERTTVNISMPPNSTVNMPSATNATERDQFALAALVGVVKELGLDDLKTVAKQSYALADAMLEVRNGK